MSAKRASARIKVPNDWVLVHKPKTPESLAGSTDDFGRFLQGDTTNFRDQATLDLPRSHVVWNHRRLKTVDDLLPWVSKRSDHRFAYASCTQAAMFPPFDTAHTYFKNRGEQIVASDTPHVVCLQGDRVTWSVEFGLLNQQLQLQRKWVHCVLRIDTRARHAWWRIDPQQQ